MPPTLQLCPHGTNPKACPVCFRIQPPAAPKTSDGLPPGVIRPGIPMGQVVSMADAMLNASRVAQQRAAPVVTRQDGSQVTMKEPYSEANRAPPPEAYNNNEEWKPPVHHQVADRQPVHPHRDEGKAEYKGPIFVPQDPTTLRAAK